jgi:hypothetical protein
MTYPKGITVKNIDQVLLLSKNTHFYIFPHDNEYTMGSVRRRMYLALLPLTCNCLQDGALQQLLNFPWSVSLTLNFLNNLLRQVRRRTRRSLELESEQNDD